MSDTNSASIMDGQEPFCDVVMKGGITSGVVYPLAAVELAKKYRLKSIGGTSAGALAAAITAAAEYGRSNGGYDRIATIPGEIAGSLLSKFQPEPNLAPIFNIFLATLGNERGSVKTTRAIKAAVLGYPYPVLVGLIPGIAILLAGSFLSSPALIVLGLLVAVVGVVIALGWRIWNGLTSELPAANYGLCSGATVEGHNARGITEWLADTIDRVASGHRETNNKPLCFGELQATSDRHAIELAMMTTDLSTRRPYRLPFRDRVHFFSKADFDKLFPKRIVDYMVAHTKSVPPERNVTGDLYYLPDAEHLPIVVAARLSLSFPLLIQAVPLYKVDFTLKNREADQPIKCWFSDGGLSSNFPMHFFDRMWPNAPTFGIALDSYDERRHGKNRVYMASGAGEGQLLPVNSIKGIGSFLLTLLDAAKDWQDNLQSILPGYRERIIHIALKESEGGLNLTMPPSLIEELSQYGKQAGLMASSPAFDLDEHRWRRFLIAMAEIEEMLDQIASSHDPQPSGAEDFGKFLDRYDFSGSYLPVSEAWKEEVLSRAKELVTAGHSWRTDPTVRSGKIPKPDPVMRITPQP